MLSSGMIAALQLLREEIDLMLKNEEKKEHIPVIAPPNTQLIVSEHLVKFSEQIENKIASDELLLERMNKETTFDIRGASRYFNNLGLKYSVSTLRNYRCKGQGPKSHIYGTDRGRGRIVYFKSEIDDWIASETYINQNVLSYRNWKTQKKRLY